MNRSTRVGRRASDTVVPPVTEELAPDESWRLLTQLRFGRLALVDVNGDPDVFPINYVVHEIDGGARVLDLHAWSGSGKFNYVRIAPSAVSGRRFAKQDAVPSATAVATARASVPRERS